MYITKANPRIGIYEKALPNDFSWQQKMQEAKALGFDFIEISIDESDEKIARLDWTDEQIYTLRQLSQQYNIPLHSMCLSAHRKYPFGSHDPEIRKQAEWLMNKAITFAYKLGIRVIQLAGYDVYYEPADKLTHARFIQAMQWSAQQAARAGVMLAVEIMDTAYLNSLTKFELLNREVNSPWFTAYPDVGNISGWNYDICTELTLSCHHIVQIHLKDSYRVKPDYAGQFRDLVIGEGDVNFAAIFATLKHIDYTAPLVIEMWAKDDRWRENIVIAQKRLHDIAKSNDIILFEQHQ